MDTIVSKFKVFFKNFGKTKRSRKEVSDIIENFLNDKGGERDWDNFTSVPIIDEELNMVRQFCSESADLYPPGPSEGWCNEEGAKKLQEVANWLKGKQSKPKFLKTFDFDK